MDESIIQQLYKLEQKLLMPKVRKSKDELLKLFSDDYVEIGSSGHIYNKQSTIETLKNEDELEITISSFKAKTLAKDVILVTYKTSIYNKSKSQNKYSFRSSIWKFSDGKWQIIFHQGTLTQ